MLDQLLKYNLVPDYLIRAGIKLLLRQRIRELNSEQSNKNLSRDELFKEKLCKMPIAINTKDANEQHYEVPQEFYGLVLGKHRKYSCGFWYENDILDTSEARMLELTCERAKLTNGQNILELGCGWGSLSLFMAEKFPQSNITGVSNSHSQRNYILEQAKIRNIQNLNIITKDMNDFVTQEKFDRIISVEMFEHMRNWNKLLEKIHSFLKNEGKLFIHIFVHHSTPYLFESKDKTDWMSTYFFSGGIMPSYNLLKHYNEYFSVKESWKVNGQHYAKTALAWLKNMDSNQNAIMEIFLKHYGSTEEAKKWFQYWRIFFMACEELWNYQNGDTWFVGHYLLEKNNSL